MSNAMAPGRHLFAGGAPGMLPAVALTVVAYGLIGGLSAWGFGSFTPIWYSNGIAVAALLLYPPARWVLFLLPIWAIDSFVYQVFGHGPAPLLGAVDAAEVLVTAALIRRTGGVRAPVFQGAQLVRVVALCALTPVLSASLAALAFQPADLDDFLAHWTPWYIAAALGQVIACPLLLSWSDPELRRQVGSRLTQGSWFAVALALAALALLVQLDTAQMVLFLTFPILVMLTWRFGLLGVTLGLVTASVGLFTATILGHGPLTQFLSEASTEERLHAAQLYLAGALLSSLPLAILVARQQRLTEDLERASAARTQFLAAMSHEIRTPMTGVLGVLDILASSPLDARQRRFVEMMHSSGRHLLAVINDILGFTRIESGRLELEDVDFVLADVTERVLSIAHPLAVDRGVALRVDARLAPSTVLQGDPQRLRQVLLNLVGNAIKFTERGEVTVSISQHADEAGAAWVRFSVKDTGIGIDPARLPQLFDAFAQADRSIARRYGGSGLGLAISKRLIEAMGGTISARSTPGLGSEFSFEVPLRPGDPERIGTQQPADEAVVAPLRVLVAEDVEVNRAVLRAMLEKQGHHLSFATTGAQALELVQSQPFDVVLMDVQMPQMDGVEATRRIRRLPAPLGEIPILGLTANVMETEQRQYLAAGMNECLAKPIDWKAVRSALARIRPGQPLAPAAVAAASETLPSVRPDAIDEDALGELRGIAGDEVLLQLLTTAMATCQRAVDALAAERADPAQVRQHAHKLKGSAGTLGLAALGAIAADIELSADNAPMLDELLDEMQRALALTRQELERRGLAPAAGAGA
jgi:signal transduction histidine kinase/CheY-like chemotaxis protein